MAKKVDKNIMRHFFVSWLGHRFLMYMQDVLRYEEEEGTIDGDLTQMDAVDVSNMVAVAVDDYYESDKEEWAAAEVEWDNVLREFNSNDYIY